MNFVFRLSGQAIDGGCICCLGSQLILIVNMLGGSLGELVWYAADVDAIGDARLPAHTIDLVGQTDQLVRSIEKVDQFLRGVFLAIRAQASRPHFRGVIDTEDPTDVDLGDAIVEIRAFDTSYFEILTRDKQVVATLTNAFGVQSQRE